jgi:hypothetical protein
MAEGDGNISDVRTAGLEEDDRVVAMERSRLIFLLEGNRGVAVELFSCSEVAGVAPIGGASEHSVLSVVQNTEKKDTEKRR